MVIETIDNKTIDEYIVVIKDIIPKKLCNTILDEYKNSDKWIVAGTGKVGEVNKKVRNCETIQISHPYVIDNDINKFNIDQEIFKVASKCIKKYNKLFKHTNIQEDTGYELLRYNEGGYYTEHTDSFLQAPRLVTASFFLNDEYEGGEFAFFNRRLKYRLNMGDVIMFPSNFMYPHEIMPITKGTRYAIITWFR